MTNKWKCPLCDDPDIALAGDLEYNGEKFEVELCEECWKHIEKYPSEIKKLWEKWKESREPEDKSGWENNLIRKMRGEY